MLTTDQDERADVDVLRDGLSEKLLNEGYNVRLSARGTSMFPVISSGDRVTISPAKGFAMGDIVMFRRHAELLCHRITRSFERDGIRFFQTRGDCSFSPDEPVAADRILGKVVNIGREAVSFRRRALLLLLPGLRFTRLHVFFITLFQRRRRGRKVGSGHIGKFPEKLFEQ